jgi:2,3-bisphosphoglycerate-independent phosphoglycerate mutase
MPDFEKAYGLSATMTSGVDLLRGLAKMAGMGILDIKGVTDALDNDYAAQAIGGLEALKKYDMVVIHVEAPDEAGHSALIDEKVESLERIDKEVVGRLREWGKDLRVLVMPDHPTPIEVQTHTDDPVPFLMWGPGFTSSGAKRFTEKEAKRTGIFLAEGYRMMGKFLER